MRRTWFFLLATVLAWLAAGTALAAARDEKPRNIILIGWDGAQRDHVNECLGRGELPNLKALSAEGAYVEIDIRGTTDTKAGWSQILTGYDPDVTGVYSNGRYQPVPEGLSIFERLEKFFGPDNFVTVAVIGKKAHCGEIDPPQKILLPDAEAPEEAAPPAKKAAKAEGEKAAKPKAEGEKAAKPKKAPAEPGSKIIVEDGKRYRVVPGKPYANMHKACDQWTFGLMLDEKVGTKALELLDQHKDKPFFFFVHFAEVDHQGHKFGENSKEYNDALISNDTWTGRIAAKLKDLGLYDKTLIYVTSDHGFDEGAKGHGKAPYVFLGTNDPKVVRRGDRADVGPTILDRFGMDLSKLQPPLAGRPLTQPAAPGK